MYAKTRIVLLLGVFLLLSSIGARAQSVAVTGSLKDLGLNNATTHASYVQFTLLNYGATTPRVIGTNVIVQPVRPPFYPDASGNISGNIQANDSITPAGTFYSVCVYYQGSLAFPCQNYIINSSPGTFNLNTATPITTIPGPYVAAYVLVNPQGVQTIQTYGLGVPSLILGSYTISGLPPPASIPVGSLVTVTNGQMDGDCVIGGGVGLSLCRNNGTAYDSLGGGGGGTIIPNTVPAVDYIPISTAANTVMWQPNFTANAGSPETWFNVMSSTYHCVGDGAADDTVCTQAAIDAQVASASGGMIYFPCGHTFKFGFLDLSQHANNGGNQAWTILNFCGTPKPTQSIVVYGHHAIIGTGGDSRSFPFGGEVPITGFDLSAYPSDNSPVIFVPDSQDVVYFDHIGIMLPPPGSDAMKLGSSVGSGPTQVTITNSVLQPNDNGTGACLESSVGFYLVLDTVGCSGSNTDAHTGLVMHGSGIIRMHNITLGRRGISLLGPALTGVIGTNIFDSIYTENLLDNALFEINTDGFNAEAISIGPSIEMSDTAGGNLYLIDHTGDSSEIKVNVVLGAVRGWTTNIFHGPNISYQIYGETSSPVDLSSYPNGVGLLNGSLVARGQFNQIGPCVQDLTNISLGICQFQASSPTVKIFEQAGGAQGQIVAGIYTSTGIPLLWLFDGHDIGGQLGYGIATGVSASVSLVSPGTGSGNYNISIPNTLGDMTLAGVNVAQNWSAAQNCGAGCTWNAIPLLEGSVPPGINSTDLFYGNSGTHWPYFNPDNTGARATCGSTGTFTSGHVIVANASGPTCDVADGGVPGSGGSVTSVNVENITTGTQNFATCSTANPGTTPDTTCTLATALAHKVFANCTGSTAAPDYQSLTEACLPGATVFTDQGATFGANAYDFTAATVTLPTVFVRTDTNTTFGTHTFDFTAATAFRVRDGAGLTTAANGDFGLDTTNHNFHGWNNGSDLLFPMVPIGTAVDGRCVQWKVTSGNVRLDVAAAACGTGSGPVLKTNAVNNSDQTQLNLANGPDITLTNTSGGIVQPTIPAQAGGGLSFLKCTITGGAAGQFFGILSSGICGNITPALSENKRTCSGYTINQSDLGKIIYCTDSGAAAVTLSSPASYTVGFYFQIEAYGSGTVTITATGSIRGGSTLAITTNNHVLVTNDASTWDASTTVGF